MLLPSFAVCLAFAFSTASVSPALPSEAESSPSFFSRAAEAGRSFFKSLDQSAFSEGTLSPYAAIAKIPHSISEYQYATANWFGTRDTLKDHGIEPSITYTSDIAGNPVGGKIPGGFTYMDNISFNCLLNLEKLMGLRDGYFLISALQRDGISLSQKNIGNIFPVQQVIGGAETMHFYEMYYEQKTHDETANIKVGRFVASDDFDFSPLYWLYMSRAIDGRPLSLGLDGRFSSPPFAVWASRLKIKLPESMVFRTGVYQVTQNSINGLNWNFYPNDGVMLLAQYEWDPEFFKPAETHNTPKPTTWGSPGAPPAKGFSGHYWMGGYYSTYEYPQFGTTVKMPNAFGLYWHGDQTVYKPKVESNEGLVLWSVATVCPQQNIAMLPFQINGGAVYTGLIPGRRNDFTILGFVYGAVSDDYASVQEQKNKGYPTYELIYEAGYRINMTKFTYIQPDLQWILNPGGAGRIPNALVLGAQMGVVF